MKSTPFKPFKYEPMLVVDSRLISRELIISMDAGASVTLPFLFSAVTRVSFIFKAEGFRASLML